MTADLFVFISTTRNVAICMRFRELSNCRVFHWKFYGEIDNGAFIGNFIISEIIYHSPTLAVNSNKKVRWRMSFWTRSRWFGEKYSISVGWFTSERKFQLSFLQNDISEIRSSFNKWIFIEIDDFYYIYFAIMVKLVRPFI